MVVAFLYLVYAAESSLSDKLNDSVTSYLFQRSCISIFNVLYVNFKLTEILFAEVIKDFKRLLISNYIFYIVTHIDE